MAFQYRLRYKTKQSKQSFATDWTTNKLHLTRMMDKKKADYPGITQIIEEKEILPESFSNKYVKTTYFIGFLAMFLLAVVIFLCVIYKFYL